MFSSLCRLLADVPFCSQGYDENDGEFTFHFLCADRNQSTKSDADIPRGNA